MNDFSRKTDQEKLSGFFRFAQGILAARDQVILRMRDTGLGCFLETEIAGLPGLKLNVDDQQWLVLERLREGRAPVPEPMLAEWLEGDINDPSKPPQFRPVIVREAAIEEASDLCEAELLDIDDVYDRPQQASLETGSPDNAAAVKIALRLERLHELRTGLDAWRKGAWETWALGERPVRKSIQLYNAFFKLHNMLHGGVAATPPELVWGMGLARWKLPSDVIDMPLIEQLVDLEVQAQGTLVIRPRDVRPSVVMKPFLHLDIEGSGETQREVQSLFAKIADSDEHEITPFDTAGWENLLDLAAGRLSGAGRHISRAALEQGAEVRPPESDLVTYSTWAIYGRPRSENIREQDLERLREEIDHAEDDSKLPASLRGYVVPAPADPADDGADWGLTRGQLGAAFSPSESAGTGSQEGPGPARGNGTDCRKAYFFPLPYNEEQAQIIDRLDSEEVHVVSVTGPPGTGKTHTIANIIGHFMATGRRVLVTARSSEAIAAVRDKLPADLASLVIASVASDRESVKQLEDAIQQLYDGVVSLNVDETRGEIARLESRIVEIDAESERCDQCLAQIAEQNLAPLTWAGEQHTAMEMAGMLAELAPKCGWLTDRPAGAPPEGLEGVIGRLRSALPRLGADLIYIDAALPDPSEIPFARELIEAQARESAHRAMPAEDFSGEPPMARDTPDAEAAAAACHEALAALRQRLGGAADWERVFVSALIETALHGKPEPPTEECVGALWTLVGGGDLAPGRLEYRVEGEDLQPLLLAAERGRQGTAPIPPFSRIFDRKLVQAVESVRLNGAVPHAEDQWATVCDTLKILEARAAIEGYWLGEAEAGRLPPMPQLPEQTDDLAALVKTVRARIPALRGAAAQALAQAEPLKRLFPYGLDVEGCLAALDLDRILRALQANMKDAYRPPAVISRLKAIAAGGEGPLFTAIGDLGDALGSGALSQGDIVSRRNAITAEIGRLQALAADLMGVGNDLEALREAGPRSGPRLAFRARSGRRVSCRCLGGRHGTGQ